MTARIDFSDLAPATRAAVLQKAGLKRAPRKAQRFQLEQVRQRALRVLNEVSDLTQSQRDRVLRHALAGERSMSTALATAAERRIERARRAATVALEAVNAVRTLHDLADAISIQAPGGFLPPAAPSKKPKRGATLCKVERARLTAALETVQRIHRALEADARRLEEWERGGRLL